MKPEHHHRKRSPFLAALYRLEGRLRKFRKPYPKNAAEAEWNAAINLALHELIQERRTLEASRPQQRRTRVQSREEENQVQAEPGR